MTFNFLLFEGKGRLHAYHDKAMIDYRWENLFQACLNEFAVTEIDRDSVIIDLDYLFAGLVTITLSCLVHCMLQGVKHTDPTAWSNSHLLQWRQIHIGCLKPVFPRAVHCFLSTISFSLSCEDGSATFHIIKCTESVQNGFHYI